MLHYHSPRWGAIALGVLCAAGAGAVLVEDARHTGLTIDHGLSIIALVIAIAAGHLAVKELRGWHGLRAAGFGLVFGAAVVFTIVSTAGRTVETQSAAAATAIARNEARQAKVSELARARARRDQADQMAEREMTGQRCQQRCEDWKLRSREVNAQVLLLEAELARLGGEQAVNAKLAGFARLLSMLTGRSEDLLLAQLVVVWPYVMPLLLELASILFWSVGLARPPRAITEREQPLTPAEIEELKKLVRGSDEPPTPTRRRRRPADVVEARRKTVSSFVAAYRAKHGTDPSPQAVRDATGLPRATAWRYQQETMGAADRGLKPAAGYGT